ncbi:MAG: alpha/beta hydrolase family protein [Verrucomicrobiia bacterium]
MKKNLSAAAVGLALASSSFFAIAQTPEPHRIGSISMTPEGRPHLSLMGSVPVPFKSYFDLFFIQASSDLIQWSDLATVVRSNGAPAAPLFLDETAAGASHRFYRTAADPVLTPFLPPSGPHAVGTFSRLLTDPSRSNRFGVATNSSFVVTFWYPARVQPGGRVGFGSYCDRLLAERRAYWGAYTNRVPSLVSYASPGLPLSPAPDRFPVIIYSHGLGDQQGRSVRTENTEKVLQLASHGYIVLALEHTDAYATVLPPGNLIVGRNAWSFNFLKDRLKDVTFLLDHLGELNASDSVFQGRLDLDRLGIMGWSWGGGTSAEALHLEERLKAAVLLDGYFDSTASVLKSGLVKPFMAMMNPSGSGDNATLFNKTAKDAYQLTIRGSTHEMFTDNAWIVTPTAVSRAQAMDACMLSFFDKHLRGQDDGLLQNPTSTLPDVVSFRKK